MAKNKFIWTAGEWCNGVKDYQVTRAKIASSEVPDAGGNILPNIRTAQWIGKGLTQMVKKLQFQCAWARRRSIWRNHLGGDERLPGRIERNLQILVTNQCTLRSKHAPKP